jgi:hypothetical protein
MQPYTFLEGVGFLNLMHLAEPRYVIPSRKYFSNTVVPEIYKSNFELLKLKLSLELENSKAAFTSDI